MTRMRDALQRLRATLSASLTRVTGKQALPLRLYRGRWLALVFAPLLLAILVNGYLAMHSLNTLTASERLVSHSRISFRRTLTHPLSRPSL